MAKNRNVSLGAILVLGCVFLAACSPTGSGSTSQESPHSNVEPTAELDYDAAIVHLPADQVSTSDQMNEFMTIDEATRGAILKCAREKTEFTLPKNVPIGDDQPIRRVYWRYGPWTKEVAEKFAFVPPMTDGELIANQLVPRPADLGEGTNYNPYADLTDADREQINEVCASDPDVARFKITNIVSDGPGRRALQDVDSQVKADPRIKQISDDLAACFVTKGMEADDRMFGFPQGVDFNAINEEQIALALKTVECKDQVDFMPRTMDIVAEYQAEIIDQYADELFAGRQKWDDALADAKQYISDHPDLYVHIEEFSFDQ